jgi:hypothetical protein
MNPVLRSSPLSSLQPTQYEIRETYGDGNEEKCRGQLRHRDTPHDAEVAEPRLSTILC